MSKDDFDDDFDLDAEFGGMDNVDGPDEFSPEPDAGNPNDRSAVSQVAAGAFRSAVSVNSARAAAKAIKENALPPGYKAVVDGADEVLSEGRKLYDSALNELKPAIDSVKSLARNNQETIEKFLPKGVAEKIKDLTKEKEARDYVDPVEASIQGTANEIFGKISAEGQAATGQYQVARDNAEDAKDSMMHQESLSGMESISYGIGRLVGYQDTVLVGYQRKSLEISQRKYFLLRDLLESSRAYFDLSRQQLAGILKNSALPDIIKMQISENYGQMVEDQLLGTVQESANAQLGKLVPGIRKAAQERMQGFASDLNSQVTDLVDQINTMQDAAADMDDAGMNKLKMAGEMGGSIGINALFNRLARSIRKKLNENEDTRQQSARLLYGVNNAKQLLNEWAQSDDGIFDAIDPEAIFGEKVSDDGIFDAIDPEAIFGEKVTKQLRERFGAKDIHLKDGDKLVDHEDLRSKKLRNLKTNTVVKRLEDIEGEVVDEHGVTVISEEQFKQGLVTKLREGEQRGGGMFANFFKDMINVAESEQTINNSLMDTATRMAEFDNITRRSIIEVIPGYLSRILEQVTNVATGRANERLTWSVEQESFVKLSEQDRNLANKLFNREEIDNRRSRADELVKEIDAEGKLSDEAQRELIDTLLYSRDTGQRFSFDRLADGSAYREGMAEQQQAELQQFFENLLVERDWILEQRLDSKFRNIAHAEQATLDAVRNYTAVGDKDALRRVGLVNNTAEGDVIDNEARLDLISGRATPTVGATELSPVAELAGRANYAVPEGPINTGLTIDYPRLAEVITEATARQRSPLDQLEMATTDGGMALPVMAFGNGDGMIPDQRIVDAIDGNFATNHMLLQQIAAQLTDMDGGYALIGSAGGMWDSLRSGAGKLTDMMSNYYSALYNGVGKVSGFAGRTLKGAGGILSGAMARDVYVPGEETPRLRAAGMRAGHYFDEETYDEIRKLADIKGAVVDDDGEVLLTAEEAKTIETRLGTSLSGVISTVTAPIRGAWSLQTAALSKGAELVGDGYNRMKELASFDRDAYIKGEDNPRLLAQVLKNGGYFSAATGAVLNKYSDIDGDVVDANGNIVLALDEMREGLVDRFGVSIDVRSAMGLAGNYLLQGSKKMLDLSWRGVKAGWKGVKGAWGMLSKGVGEVRDWFSDSDMPDWAKGLFGPDSPYLEAIYSLQVPNMELLIGQTMGDRYSSVLNDQLLVQTKIYEYLSGEALTFAEAPKDTVLVGADGKPLVNTSGELQTETGTLKERAAKTVASAKVKAKEVFDGATAAMPTGVVETLDRLRPDVAFEEQKGLTGMDIVTNDEVVDDTSIKGYMQAQLHAVREMAGLNEDADDADGDGYRDGSWQERAARKKQEIQDKIQERMQTSEEKQEKSGGFLTGILGALGGLGSTLTGGFSMLRDVLLAKAGASALDSASDIFGGGDVPDGPDGKNKPGGKKPGRFGRFWQGAKNLLRPAAGLFGRTAATAAATSALPAAASTGVGSAIASGATTAAATGGGLLASGAAALAAAPVTTIAAGVAAVAGVGWLGYKTYKYFHSISEVEPLEGLRFLQYGVHLKDQAFVAHIRRLEDEVIDGIEVSDSGVQIDKKPLDYFEEFGEDMGMSLESPADSIEWVTWFTKRFMPVFLTHLQVAYRLDDGVDLLDIDDELDEELKAEFIRRVQFTEADKAKGLDPYNWAASPLKGTSLMANTGAVLAEYVRRLTESIRQDRLDDFDVLPPAPKKTDENLDMSVAMERQQAITKRNAEKALGVERLRGGMQKPPPPVVDVPKPTDRKTPDSKATPTKGALEWPTDGVISSDFGMRKHPIDGRRKPHKGIDIAAPTGTPVYAADEGHIYRQYYSKSYGNVIYLRHKDGSASRYAHLHGFAPGTGVGKPVGRGQTIGYVGNTGASAGPHLHFEYRENADQYAKALNPVDYFESAEAMAARKASQDAKRAVKEEEALAKEDPIEGHNTLADTTTTTYKVNGVEVSKEVYDQQQAAVVRDWQSGDTSGASPAAVPATVSDVDALAGTVSPAAVPVVNVNPVSDSPLMDKMLQDNAMANKSAATQRTEQLQVQKDLVNRMDRMLVAVEKNGLQPPTVVETVEEVRNHVGPTRSTTRTAPLVEQPPRPVAHFTS